MECRVNRFPFFLSYYDAYAALSNESDKVKFIDALMKYAFFGEEPDLPENLAPMFILAKPNIEKSVKNALQGARNGKKGGAPNGNQNARKKFAEEITTPGLNENKADKDKEKEKDMEYGENNNPTSVSTDGQTERPDIDFDSLADRS
jgi:hypothetical protein